MTKLDAGLMTSLPASDPGSAAIWGSKRINPRPQSCLCLTWSGYPSNDDDDDDDLRPEVGRYWPFRKPNDQPLYIHRLSNHPPVIKKQLPLMLATRLLQLSCDSKEFSNAVPEYVEAMQRSEHTGKLEYADNLGSKKKKKKKRNITWFNPPFSQHVKTNIGKEFLRLLAKHFPLHYQLHKICNKFNVKVSYSCMPNMAISRHNKIVLSNKTNANSTTPPCNCKNKVSCPLEGKCRESSVVYKACLISGNAANNYYGCCETEFKAVSTTITKALNTGERATPPNSPKLFGRLKTREKTSA